MNILLTICARKGSKGIPGKNIRPLAGKPLALHTIEAALQWGKATDIVVSSDSEQIINLAQEAGAQAPFKRPKELAQDDSAKLPVIQHCLNFMEENKNINYDLIVDLDPTSPLRKVEDIEKGFQKIKDNPQFNNIYSVTGADKNPYFNMVELDEDGYAHLSKKLPDGVTRRQDAPEVYEMNASIYFYRRDFLLDADSIHSDQTGIFIMPPERSVDIDRPLDFKFVEFLMEVNG